MTGTERVLTIQPGATPARDLPFGLVADVCDVLDTYGLRVKVDELNGQGIVEVMMALSRLIDAVPVEHGGRLVPDEPHDHPRD